MNQNDTITYFNELYQTNKRYHRAGGSGFAYGFHHQPCTPESPMQCWYTIIIIIFFISSSSVVNSIYTVNVCVSSWITNAPMKPTFQVHPMFLMVERENIKLIVTRIPGRENSCWPLIHKYLVVTYLPGTPNLRRHLHETPSPALTSPPSKWDSSWLPIQISSTALKLCLQIEWQVICSSKSSRLSSQCTWEEVLTIVVCLTCL